MPKELMFNKKQLDPLQYAVYYKDEDRIIKCLNELLPAAAEDQWQSLMDLSFFMHDIYACTNLFFQATYYNMHNLRNLLIEHNALPPHLNQTDLASFDSQVRTFTPHLNRITAKQHFKSKENTAMFVNSLKSLEAKHPGILTFIIENFSFVHKNAIYGGFSNIYANLFCICALLDIPGWRYLLTHVKSPTFQFTAGETKHEFISYLYTENKLKPITAIINKFTETRFAELLEPTLLLSANLAQLELIEQYATKLDELNNILKNALSLISDKATSPPLSQQIFFLSLQSFTNDPELNKLKMAFIDQCPAIKAIFDAVKSEDDNQICEALASYGKPSNAYLDTIDFVLFPETMVHKLINLKAIASLEILLYWKATTKSGKSSQMILTHMFAMKNNGLEQLLDRYLILLRDCCWQFDTLLDQCRYAAWRANDAHDARIYDALCKQLRPFFNRHNPRIESDVDLVPVRVCDNRQDVRQVVKTQLRAIFKRPDVYIPLLQEINTEFALFCTQREAILNFRIDDTRIKWCEINGVPFPFPKDETVADDIPKRESALTLFLREYMIKFGLGAQKLKYIGYISIKNSTSTISNGDFFTENHVGHTLFHGKLTHMLQWILILKALKKKLISQSYYEDPEHNKIVELGAQDLAQIMAGDWQSMRDARNYSYVTFSDPYIMHSVCMHDGNSDGYPFLANYLTTTSLRDVIKFYRSNKIATTFDDITLEEFVAQLQDIHMNVLSSNDKLHNMSVELEQKKNTYTQLSIFAPDSCISNQTKLYDAKLNSWRARYLAGEQELTGGDLFETEALEKVSFTPG